MRFIEFEKKIKTLMEFAEIIIRGGLPKVIARTHPHFNLDAMLKLANELFDAVSDRAVELDDDAITSDGNKNSSSNSSQQQRALIPNLAVKLHNKVRNVTASQAEIAEFKSLTRSLSAFMIHNYSESSLKILITAIKIIGSAGIENFASYRRSISALGLACSCWETIKDRQLVGQLAHADNLEAKIIVFKALLAQAKLHVAERLTQSSFHEARQALLRASELSYSLHDNLKLTFTEQAIAIGMQVLDNPNALEEAKVFLLIANNALDQLLTGSQHQYQHQHQHQRVTEADDRDNTSGSFIGADNLHGDALQLRHKTLLALTYLYLETNDSTNAMGCVHMIETALSRMDANSRGTFQSTVSLAKVLIYTKNGEISLAWDVLNGLLSAPESQKCSFEIAMEASRVFASRLSSAQEGTLTSAHMLAQMFKLLSSRYTSDSDLMEIRIQQLQMLITTLTMPQVEGSNSLNLSTSSVAQHYQLLVDVSNLIVSDHVSGTRKLIGDDLQLVQRIFAERIQCYRSQQQWTRALEWIELMLNLFRAPATLSVSDDSSYLLMVIDCLIHIGRYEEAHDKAIKNAKSAFSNRALLFAFKAALYVKKPVHLAIDELLALSSRGASGGGQQDFVAVNDDPGYHGFENLTRLLQCYEIAATTTGSLDPDDRLSVQSLLLKEWLLQFYKQRTWRYMDCGDSDNSLVGEESSNCAPRSFFGVCSLYLSKYLKLHLTKTVVAVKQGEDSMSKLVTLATASADKEPASCINSSTQQSLHTVVDHRSIKLEGRIDIDMGFAGVEAPLPLPPILPSSSLVEITSSNKSRQLSQSTVNDNSYICGVFNYIRGLQGSVLLLTNSPHNDTQASPAVIQNIMGPLPSPPSSPTSTAVTEPQIPHGPERATKESTEDAVSPSTPTKATSAEICVEPMKRSYEYSLLRNVDDMNAEVLAVIGNIPKLIDALRRDGFKPDILGSPEDYLKIADLLWNFGVLAVRSDICAIIEPQSIRGNSQSVAHTALAPSALLETRLLLGAEYLERAAAIYGNLSDGSNTSGNVSTTSYNYGLCLILASGARIDAKHLASSLTNQESEGKGASLLSLNDREYVDNLKDQPNLETAFNNALSARSKLTSSNQDSSMNQLVNVALFFAFSSLCHAHPRLRPDYIEQFIASRRHEFLGMAAEDLLACAEVASAASSGTIGIVKTMYEIGLEVCKDNGDDGEAYPAIMGTFYDKLIRLSPNRRQALATIKEFRKIVESTKNSNARTCSSNGSKEAEHFLCAFNEEDIERVCATAYNYGITLLELASEPALAENFIAQALSLLPFASLQMADDWGSRMQEAYSQVLSKISSASKPQEVSVLLTFVAHDSERTGAATNSIAVPVGNLGSGSVGSSTSSKALKRDASTAGLSSAGGGPAKELVLSVDNLH